MDDIGTEGSMRTAEVVDKTVKFRQYESGELIFTNDVLYPSVDHARWAAYHFLNEYTDFLPFGDEDEHNS